MTTSRRSAVVLACLCLSLAAPGAARAGDPGWAADPSWGVDKALHLTVGLALGASCYGFLWAVNGRDDPRALRLALCTTLAQAPGLAKELYDAGRPHNFFSVKDLLWTTAGVIAGALVVWLVERLTSKEPAGKGPGTTSRPLGTAVLRF